MKRKRPVGGSIYLSIKSPLPKRKRRDDSSPPDAEVPSPEVTQVAGPVVTDNATPKMERKSKSFEPSLTCARDAEILTNEFTVRKNKAEKVVTVVSNHAKRTDTKS